MSRSHVGKVELDIIKLQKDQDRAVRRRDSLNIQIFRLGRMIEGLKAATTIATTPAPSITPLPDVISPTAISGQGE